MLRFISFTILVCVGVVNAAESVPSDASIREILQITDARKLVEGILPQVKAQMDAGVAQALAGKEPTPEERAVLERFSNKAVESITESISWSKLEPMYLRMYRQTLSQEEVDGIVAFYKTPAGQAVIKKLPVLMTSILTEIQQMMGPMMEKMQILEKEAQAEMARLHQQQSK